MVFPSNFQTVNSTIFAIAGRGQFFLRIIAQSLFIYIYRALPNYYACVMHKEYIIIGICSLVIIDQLWSNAIIN